MTNPRPDAHPYTIGGLMSRHSRTLLARGTSLCGALAIIFGGFLMVPGPGGPGPSRGRSPGPILAQEALPPVPSVTTVPPGMAGVIVALTGMLALVLPFLGQFWNSHKLKQQNEELQNQLNSLKHELPANSSRIAANKGEVEAIRDMLRARGILAPPRSGDLPVRPRSTVLIVEDDADTAKLLMRLFTLHGFACTHAPTIEDAIKLAYFRPHWVILDLAVAGGDGLDVLKLVKAEGLGCRVVVTTGLRDEERLREVRALDPVDIVRKPIDFDDLIGFMSRFEDPRPPSTTPGPTPERPS